MAGEIANAIGLGYGSELPKTDMFDYTKSLLKEKRAAEAKAAAAAAKAAQERRKANENLLKDIYINKNLALPYMHQAEGLAAETVEKMQQAFNDPNGNGYVQAIRYANDFKGELNRLETMSKNFQDAEKLFRTDPNAYYAYNPQTIDGKVYENVFDAANDPNIYKDPSKLSKFNTPEVKWTFDDKGRMVSAFDLQKGADYNEAVTKAFEKTDYTHIGGTREEAIGPKRFEYDRMMAAPDIIAERATKMSVDPAIHFLEMKRAHSEANKRLIAEGKDTVTFEEWMPDNAEAVSMNLKNRLTRDLSAQGFEVKRERTPSSGGGSKGPKTFDDLYAIAEVADTGSNSYGIELAKRSGTDPTSGSVQISGGEEVANGNGRGFSKLLPAMMGKTIQAFPSGAAVNNGKLMLAWKTNFNIDDPSANENTAAEKVIYVPATGKTLPQFLVATSMREDEFWDKMMANTPKNRHYALKLAESELMDRTHGQGTTLHTYSPILPPNGGGASGGKAPRIDVSKLTGMDRVKAINKNRLNGYE